MTPYYPPPPFPGMPRWGFFIPDNKYNIDNIDNNDNNDNIDNIDNIDLVLPVQTHTVNVAVAYSPSDHFPDTDALITQKPDIAVGVRTADCVPVLVYAPDIRAVAAIHAGWKGSIGRIVGNTILKLHQMGSDPKKCHAVIAPCICLDCYEVNDDLADAFVRAGFGKFVSHAEFSDPLTGISMPRKPHLDLPGINRQILLEAGLRPENVHILPLCTRHNPPLPSWRRTPGETHRLISWISLSS